MPDLVARWAGRTFQDELLGWADQALAARGEHRTGPVQEVKIRFWSAVFRIPLGTGRAYLKVANPGQAFEGELLRRLGQIAPEHVVAPWAVEAEQGWSLLPDGGATLSHDRELDWTRLLVGTAELQRACAGHARVLDLVPRYAVGHAADHAAHLLEKLAGLPTVHPQHLGREDARRCRAGLPRLREAMTVLAATVLPDTLQPNDAHPGNAVGPAGQGGQVGQGGQTGTDGSGRTPAPVRVFDLGDAVWSHPWAVLHAPGRGVAEARLVDPWPGQDPRTRRLVDAYAEHWPEVDRADRPVVLAAAERLGALHRVASWERLLGAAGALGPGVAPPRLAVWLAQALR